MESVVEESQVSAEDSYGLVPADRCDACASAQALLITEHGVSPLPLYWCAHCFTKQEAALIGGGAVVAVDARAELPV